MLYDLLIRLYKQNFFIVNYEKLKAENSEYFLERYIAKHPLVKPKLIMHNDQPYGFKKISKKLATLENFAIITEIEYLIIDNIKYVESIDLYTEIPAPSKAYMLKDWAQKALEYTDYLSLERVKSIQGSDTDLIVIASKIDDFVYDKYENLVIEDIDEDTEEAQELVNLQEVEKTLKIYFSSFLAFIKYLNQSISK